MGLFSGIKDRWFSNSVYVATSTHLQENAVNYGPLYSEDLNEISGYCTELGLSSWNSVKDAFPTQRPNAKVVAALGMAGASSFAALDEEVRSHLSRASRIFEREVRNTEALNDVDNALFKAAEKMRERAKKMSIESLKRRSSY